MASVEAFCSYAHKREKYCEYMIYAFEMASDIALFEWLSQLILEIPF